MLSVETTGRGLESYHHDKLHENEETRRHWRAAGTRGAASKESSLSWFCLSEGSGQGKERRGNGACHLVH